MIALGPGLPGRDALPAGEDGGNQASPRPSPGGAHIAPAVVVVPGRPPSPNKRRAHFMAQHRDQAGRGSWKERAWMLAQSARNEAGWDLPVRTDPPRYLEIETFRRGELDPFDNAPGSLKAIVDGLKRVLTWDDKPPWCFVVRFQPHKVKTEAEERTVIRVYREDPR